MRSTEGISGMSEFEFREAADMVILAADAWLARDLQEFSDIEVEVPLENGKVILDIVATMRGTIAPFTDYKGRKVIIDWKTTGGPVDGESFRRRYIRSWQWRKYASAVPEASLFIYRGLSRSLDIRSRGESNIPANRTRELSPLVIHNGVSQEVSQRWNGILGMRNSLVNIGTPWPQNTDSCDDFGEPCPFYNECLGNYQKLTIPELSDTMSYSKAELFLRCPERYRLTLLSEQIEDPTEQEYCSTTFGSCVHVGLAALWMEAFEKRENL